MECIANGFGIAANHMKTQVRITMTAGFVKREYVHFKTAFTFFLWQNGKYVNAVTRCARTLVNTGKLAKIGINS